MTPAEWNEAAERGRSMAAQAVATDPEARARVEAKFGQDFCRQRWPEAYKENSQ